MQYAGLIEIALTFGGFVVFIIWQMRTLKRDIKARQEREAREHEHPPVRKPDD
jgi:heme exporter protein D